MDTKHGYWTIRHPEGWGVKRQGSREVSAVYERQQDAWREARRLAAGKAGEERAAVRQIPALARAARRPVTRLARLSA